MRSLAQVIFEAYAETGCWMDFQGTQFPETWEELGAEEQACWEEAAKAARKYLR